MIYLDLILNLALLVALSIVSGFVEKRWPRNTRTGVLVQGFLFGGTAVVGMLRPLNLGPGLIFDGRSVMLSLCAMFHGPWAGSTASVMTALCRIELGGAGAFTGVLVIASSTAIGLLGYYRLRPNVTPPSIQALYLFGVVVHLAMIALMFTLPENAGPAVVGRIGPPVMLLFPLATILAGKILSDQVAAARTLEDLRATKQNLAITLQSIGDAVISTNLKGEIAFMNPVAETLTGWSQAEAFGKPLGEVLRVVNERTRENVEDPVSKVLREGKVVGLANHTLLMAKDGTERPIADSAAPIRDERGKCTGVVMVFRDQDRERRAHRLMQARLALLEYATTHTLDELLTKALDETCALVDSPIGFYHFVEADQKTLSPQQWSTRTLMEFCRAEGKGMHCGIDRAGVWVECVHRKEAVVHNDYASLPHRKGLPEGHAEVVRELVVPIMKQEAVVAVLGVGNKPSDYTEEDVETVSYLADVTWQIVDKKHTEEALRESEERFRVMSELSHNAICILDENGKIIWANRKAVEISGYTKEQILQAQSFLQFLAPESVEFVTGNFMKFVEGKEYEQHYFFEIIRADGRKRLMEKFMTDFSDSRGKKHLIVSMLDITERKQAEGEQERLRSQLLQVQKMEAVGRLAGGVAHDFNNMLSIIIGHAEMILAEIGPDSPFHPNVMEMKTAALRSADLTRQLLAFARKQTVSPRILDLNETAAGILKMLRRLIGEDINLVWVPGPGVWPVKIDPSQLDQVLANLAVNARDAIGGVGTMTIETANVVLDESYCRTHRGFTPGDYAMLAVSDTGAGMDKETVDHIFEPFYTTKELGKGTGLGLSTVYGIVKQNHGFINVYSEPGRGAAFKIYLPRAERQAEEKSARGSNKDLKGIETVLLVEDEESILTLGKAILTRHGYTVLAANRPEEALRIAESHPGRIDLLITDVVMPGMNGKDLEEKLNAVKPGFKCIYMSGYTANVIAHHGVLDEGIHFLQKPFSVMTLAEKVREVLDT